MARRILHVANAYGVYQNKHPAEIIQAVHNNIYNKFKRTAFDLDKPGSGSAQEAKELEDFFYGLKNYAKYGNANQLSKNIDLDMIQKILSNIAPKFNRLTSKLFRYTSDKGYKQGQEFENELSLVIEEVLSMGSGKNIQNGITKLGAQTINIQGKTNEAIDVNVEKMEKEVVEAVGQAVYKKIQNMKTKYSGVQGKIDISGSTAKVEITANPNSYLGHIAYLLSKANISAKSYSSSYWVGKIKMKIYKISQELRLGSTDLKRIYIDIFTKEAGTPPPVSLSLYMYLQNTKNNQLRTAASRLRFVYELTGYGQTYVNKEIQNILNEEGISHANYIIYNDPSSDNIYVQSTAKIIIDMWNEVDDIIRQSSVNISKSFFAQSSLSSLDWGK